MRCFTFTKGCVQISIFFLAFATVFVLFAPSLQYDFAGAGQMYGLYDYTNQTSSNRNSEEAHSLSEATPSLIEDIIDYSRCSPTKPLRIFVYDADHPLAKALQLHPTATKVEAEACLFIALADGSELQKSSPVPSTWDVIPSAPGANHVIINLNDDVSIAPRGSEMIVQAHFEKSHFRSLLDFSFSTAVLLFSNATWIDRPSIMPLHREVEFALVSDTSEAEPAAVAKVQCASDCASSLNSTSFCLLPPSASFQSRLLSSLKGGCIPVVLSSTQPLPFQDQLDWNLASFRFPLSMLPSIPEMLEEMEKEELIELRRRGRVFLARIDDAEALATSLVAALSDRVHLSLPLHPEVHANVHSTLAPNGIFKNQTLAFERSKSKAQKMIASRLYSRSRWNSGRALTYIPRTVFDVPLLPGDAGIDKDIKSLFAPLNGKSRLGLTRDEEQFTVIILTYDRDAGVKKVIEKLRDCPHLNKVIIVWNHQERRPNGTWPEIHVPVEFTLSEKNTLNSRFLPYDSIETEAVFSMDDDCHFTQPELVFGFKVWRENRDRVVGFPDRTHRFRGRNCVYGMYIQCEHSMILTGLTFFHKEFLFEYTHNQHPTILDHVHNNRNCEDIAMNMLVSHLTRKPPIAVIKPSRLTPWGSKPGLSGRKAHSRQRGDCLQMFSDIYGYNPLLYSQTVVSPHARCRNGL